MSLIGLAGKCGITTSALKDLIQETVRAGVAGKLGVTRSSLQRFVDGDTSIGLAGKIGITSSSLRELRSLNGAAGAIGLMIGLMIKENSK